MMETNQTPSGHTISYW